MKYRQQTVRISIATAKVAGTAINAGQIKFDPKFERATGVQLLEIAGSDQLYSVLMSGGSGDVQEKTYKSAFVSTSNLPHGSRFMKLDIPASGNTLDIYVTPDINTTSSAITFDLVFQLENTH